MAGQVILVDTNAWISHFRKTDKVLVDFLMTERVRTCDVVIGKLLLGAGLPKGAKEDLLALPRLPSPSPTETRLFIERHQKTFAGAGAGVGWADAQIIHAAVKSGARLHTSDRSVKRVCKAVGCVLA